MTWLLHIKAKRQCGQLIQKSNKISWFVSSLLYFTFWSWYDCTGTAVYCKDGQFHAYKNIGHKLSKVRGSNQTRPEQCKLWIDYKPNFIVLYFESSLNWVKIGPVLMVMRWFWLFCILMMVRNSNSNPAQPCQGIRDTDVTSKGLSKLSN